MPSGVLEHQNPGADTSHNPTLSSSGGCAGILDRDTAQVLRFLSSWMCNASGQDAGGSLVVGAIAIALRRRHPSW
jgi:uncharacterized protein (TIGR03382 family)